MLDRDKVIQGLECCCEHIRDKSCQNCPYDLQYGIPEQCSSELAYDALALLKEQEEPAKPIVNNGDKGVSWWYRCSACGREINFKTHFCQWCGKSLTWN